MRHLLRRASVGALAALVLAALLVTVGESPAEARKVANPGTGFTLRVQQGFLRIKQESFDFNDETRQPQCSDGQNNDEGQDTAVDWPADGQCTSATDDSEAAGGFQQKLPIQLTNGTVNADGTFTFNNISFPNQYLWVADAPVVGSFLVTIQIVQLAPATGTINPATGEMTLNMSVEVRASGGELNSGCKVGPINVTGLTTGTKPAVGSNPSVTGVGYNPGTGRATLVENTYAVPGASGCTATFLNVNVNGEINSQLGLPSTTGNNEASFLGEFIGTRPQPGVAAQFTATPSSGPAPLAVAFNSAGSVGLGATYQWDFTNNGSFDASGPTANFTYTTAGVHTARLRVTDQDGDIAETTRTISVGANQPPVPSDQTVTTPEDTAVGVTLTGSDVEGAPLTYALATPAPAHGTLTGTAPNLTYTPNADYNGADSFGFSVSDGFNAPVSGLVTVNVTPVNDAPTASNVTATIVEDTPGSVALVGNDVDGDPLTYAIVDPPTKGSLSGTGPSRTYTPDANQNGVDTFTYEVSDGTATSNTATGTITITPVNDLPVATDQVVATDEDTPLPITLSGTDDDGTPLTFSIVTPPAHGTLGGVLPNLTYTPATNYNGPDALTFRVTDPTGATDTGTVDITVNPVNDPPTTADLSIGTGEDTPVDVTIPGNDLDGDPLTFTPASPTPGGGTVDCTGAVCTYTPAPGFAGTDTFTVDVSDGTATATSTVTVNVLAFNNTLPVMQDQTFVALEDVPRSFGLVSIDADGHTRTHTVLIPPTSGSVDCAPSGACTYTPAPDVNGPVSFTAQVNDGVGGIDTAVITINIVPINDAPTIPAQSLTTNEDEDGTIDLAAADVDGDTLTWTIKVAPTKGSITCTPAGSCTYTPNPNVNGSDSFRVEVDDGKGARVQATIPVSIAAVDDPPTAGTVAVSTAEDTAAAPFALIGADDSGSVTFEADPAMSGSLACDAAGACTFAPAPDANGTQTVAYTVSDGTSSATGIIVITVVPVNDAPTAVSQTVTTDEDTPVAVTLTATDPDAGDALTYEITSVPSLGYLGGTAPNLTYTPGTEASGTVTIGFRVTDAAGLTSTATVTIMVVAMDDLPVATSASITTPEDTPKAVALTGTDAEGPVTSAVVVPPAHGTYAAGIYTPDANYFGPDAIGFSVTSTTGQVANGSITIVVTPVNDAPVATDAAVSTTRATPTAITLGSTDADGTAGHAFAVVSSPSKGTLSGTAPNLTYTPNGLVTGADVFTFTVTDPSGLVDSGTVSVTITAGGALPTHLTVAPATVTRPGGLFGFLQQYTYHGLSATLRTTGSDLPVAGVGVVFRVNGTGICGAITNAAGVATCSGKGPRVNAWAYEAIWAGDASFAASSATGPLS